MSGIGYQEGALDGASTHCPLCYTAITGKDNLQLHYLTSCSGYDKLNDQPRPKPKKVLRDDPEYTPPSVLDSEIPSTSSRGGTRVGGTLAAHFSEAMDFTPQGSDTSSQSASSVVRFMWQPLTEITYPEITLLASFEPGSIGLTLDSEGAHYESGSVSIPNGTYEGQLVIGESFVYPVKEFTIKTDDVVVLQFDIELQATGDPGYMSHSSPSQYGSGYMQQNPSFSGQYLESTSYSNDIKTGRRKSPVGSSVATADYTGLDSSPSSRADNVYAYYEGFTDTAETASQIQPPPNYQSPHQTAPPTDTHSSIEQGQYSVRKHRSSSHSSQGRGSSQKTISLVTEELKDQPTKTGSRRSGNQITGSDATGKKRLSSSPLPRVSSTHREQRVSPTPVPQTRSKDKQEDEAGEGFNVAVLQQDAVDEDIVTQRLQEVIQERDRLKQDQERVNARWDGRVKRLEAQLERARSGSSLVDNSNLVDTLREAQARVTHLEREVHSLKSQQGEVTAPSENSAEVEKEISELKDRNTALEQQLEEYCETLSDQTKYIQNTVASSKAQIAETLKSRQELITLTSFLKKQQAEYAESLSSSRKHISCIQSNVDEVMNLRQINVTLTTELEDYHMQIERMLEDLKQKDKEIGELQGALSQRGPLCSDKAQLEIAIMQEKLTAWQEEFEKIIPLKNEVEQLRDLVSTKDEEIKQLLENSNYLTGQNQSFIDEREVKKFEMQRRKVEYDLLMERFTTLQQTRVYLENEVQPLREERAGLLRENAQLREGSDPQNYAKLKTDYEALANRCQELETMIANQAALLSAYQDSNIEMQTKLDQATDPEKLYPIRSRMEKYKQERDKARHQIEELETEKQQLLKQLESTEVFINECKAAQLAAKEEVTTELSLCKTKVAKYRDERNILKSKCKALQLQLDDWKLVIGGSHRLQQPETLVSDQRSRSPSHGEQPASPLTEYQQQTYDDDQHQPDRESDGSPMNEIERGLGSLAIEQQKSHRKKRASSGSQIARTGVNPESFSYGMVDVKTSKGVKTVYVQKCRGELNAKNKLKVIVKRGDVYEQGILMFLGQVQGKELAGVHLECSLGTSKTLGTGVTDSYDGTCENDGKRYFRCPRGHGIYVNVSKVYLEMDEATV